MGELPTRDKLQALRYRGIVPHSHLATRAWILAAVFAVLLFSAERLMGLLRKAANDWQSAVADPRGYLQPLALIALGFSVTALMAGILGSVAQTRGVVGTSQAREHNGLRQRLGAALGVLVAGSLIGLLAIAHVGLSARELLSLLRVTDVAQVGGKFGTLADRFCKEVVVGTVVLAILVMFVSRALFLFRYREKK